MRLEAERLGPFAWRFPATGDMRVPLVVFASRQLLDSLSRDRSLEQARNVTTLPGIRRHAALMPDAHQGYGFPVGLVAAFDPREGCITPGGIGYDINCGVRLAISALRHEEVEPELRDLLEDLFRNVHCGLGSHSSIRLSPADLDTLLERGVRWCLERGYAEPSDADRCEERGCMGAARAETVSREARERGVGQLGTLGAGNHFVEIQRVDEIVDASAAAALGLHEPGQVALMIHSGSRGLGHQVCTDFLRRIEKQRPDLVARLPDRELAYAPAGSELADDYLAAMSAAANFGWCNRQLILHLARSVFERRFGAAGKLELVYDVAHNICKVEEHEVDGRSHRLYVHRKGATRAFPPGSAAIPAAWRELGQPVLLPGSMGTGSWLLLGTAAGLQRSFGSTAHGAGRVMSRHAALRRFTGQEVREALERRRILVRSASWKGLAEEAPEVYKDVEEVVRVAEGAGIARRVARLLPIGVLKG